jgi:MFS family permease
MGVASLEAAGRFNTNASQLASLAVLQLVVYAAMQIPVGLLLDRFGARAMLITGGLVMAAGQLIVANSFELWTAVIGRMAVGMGDAFTFISMIRLTNNWLSGRVAALAQQWLATIGQLGQVLSAFPFAFALHTFGWSSAFTGIAAVGVMVSVLVLALAREGVNPQSFRAASLGEVFVGLRRNIKRPAVQMAFWTHFVTQSAGTTFALLWGVPFLVGAQGLTRVEASYILTVLVVTNALLGLVFGILTSRWPHRRAALVMTVVVLNATSIAGVCLMAHPVGQIGLVLFAVLIGTGGPASMIAFDFSRSYVDARELGAANGFINTGGFLASLTMMFLVGVVLDAVQAQTHGDLYVVEGFRWAFASQLLVVAVGAGGFLTAARRTRRTEKIRF